MPLPYDHRPKPLPLEVKTDREIIHYRDKIDQPNKTVLYIRNGDMKTVYNVTPQ